MSNKEIVITSAFRTAIGSFGGSLSSKTAPELGAEVIKKCLEHSEVKGNEVDTVFMGQVLQAGAKQNNDPSEKGDTVKTEAKNEEINKLASQIDELKSQISKLNKEKIN